MIWIRNLFKITSYNFFIFFILISLFFFASFIFNKINTNAEDNRSKLINYTDIKWADNHFQEFGKLNTIYRDYFTWRREEYYGQTINIDKNGIRKSFSYENDTNRNNISFLFFGGSAMWGTGSNDENTIPSLFAKKNKQKVINYGETGYNSIQSLNFLNTLIITNKINLDKKIVIFYDGVNNVSYNCQVKNSGLETTRASTLNKLIRDSSTKNIRYYLRPFLDIFSSLKLSLRVNHDNKNYRNCDDNKEKANIVATNLINTWVIARQIVEKNGGVFVPILQPVIYIGDVKKDHLNYDLEPDLGRNFLSVYALIKNKAKKIFGNKFIDLTDVFDDSSYYYIDYCHYSPNGNDIIADEITKELKTTFKINL